MAMVEEGRGKGARSVCVCVFVCVCVVCVYLRACTHRQLFFFHDISLVEQSPGKSRIGGLGSSLPPLLKRSELSPTKRCTLSARAPKICKTSNSVNTIIVKEAPASPPTRLDCMLV